MIRRTNRQQSRVGRRVASLALAAVLVSFAGVAQALTLDFTGESGENLLGLGTGVLGHSIDISVGPLDVEITGWDAQDDPGRIHRNRNGLGVYSNPGGNGISAPESIQFAFSGSVVAIEALILERGSDEGSLDFYVDGEFQETIDWETGRRTMMLHDLGEIAGRTFELRGDSRSFRVSQLTVAVGSVSAMPEPSAALLFAVGLLVAASTSDRRRSA